MKENSPGTSSGSVFILAIRDADIIFLPETNEIVSVLKQNVVETTAAWEAQSPGEQGS